MQLARRGPFRLLVEQKLTHLQILAEGGFWCRILVGRAGEGRIIWYIRSTPTPIQQPHTGMVCVIRDYLRNNPAGWPTPASRRTETRPSHWVMVVVVVVVGGGNGGGGGGRGGGGVSQGCVANGRVRQVESINRVDLNSCVWVKTFEISAGSVFEPEKGVRTYMVLRSMPTLQVHNIKCRYGMYHSWVLY